MKARLGGKKMISRVMTNVPAHLLGQVVVPAPGTPFLAGNLSRAVLDGGFTTLKLRLLDVQLLVRGSFSLETADCSDLGTVFGRLRKAGRPERFGT